MPRALNVRRSIALTSAVALTAGGAFLVPAAADPGNAKGHGNGHDHAPGQQKDKGHQDKGNRGKSGQDKANGGKGNQGHPGTSHPSGNANGHSNVSSGAHPNGNANGHANGTSGNGHGDPAGNNGTVKIAPLGEMDSIPNNTPHPGCTFQVEWYGFDEGADVVSTVTFAMQAPTSDADLSVAGPQSVFVGGDPASGAGTATGLDGRETYTLSFTGEPHPKQGYHVKLTVATPRSQGNDTKTKVFWVAPCTTDSGTGTGGTGTGASSTHHHANGANGTHAGSDAGVLGTQAAASGDSGEADSSSTADSATADSAGTAADSAVPTAVDAGEDAAGPLGDLVDSPWPLALAGLGGAVALGAVAARRRTASDVGTRD